MRNRRISRKLLLREGTGNEGYKRVKNLTKITFFKVRASDGVVKDSVKEGKRM